MTNDAAVTAVKLVHALMDEDDILNAGRLLLARLSDEERVQFRHNLYRDYCQECGRKLRNESDHCSCTNDE
jgi:hypothetical protein